ncbi:MAG: RICIN domain-containing protein [Pseudomonadota bacterium]
MNSTCWALIGGVLSLMSLATVTANESDGDYIRLVDALDEPEFYCFDLAGWGRNLLLDDPLQTHTCKGRGGEDQMFHFADGQLKVSRYDRCIQIAGSSGVTLAGSAVIARPCSDSPLQRLVMDDAGRVRLSGTEYCLAAGADSAEASGPSHLWRTLSLADCASADPAMSRWQVGLADP